MYEDPSQDEDDDNRPVEKQPWQVVTCPQCKMPPGMRCKGSRMKTHGPRRHLFFEKIQREHELDMQDELEAEHRALEEAEKSHIQEIKSTPALPFPKANSNRDREQERMERDEERRKKRNRKNSLTQRQIPDKNKHSVEIVKPIGATILGTKVNYSPDDWKRIEDVPPWEDIPERLLKKEERTSVMPPAAAATAPPPTTPFSLANFKPKQEDTSIWKSIACPTCRATDGTRCFETLGQVRFASHPSRLKAYNDTTN